MAAPGGLSSSTIYQQHHRASISAQSGAPTPPAGPTGATAQTGGFVGASGGGLQTSPNVPAPGTTINPATGKPHTAGLTRAELEAIRAKGADLLDPSPHTDAVRRGSTPSSPTAQFGVLGGVGGSPEQRRLSELSGREQAARQLTATAPGTGEPITPGKELPGGWGPTPQVPAPGTAPGAPTSIYEDVTTTLDKVGRTAYNVLPSSVKEVLSSSPNPPSERTRNLSNASELSASSATGGRRSSVMMFFDKVKTDGANIAKEIQTNLATVDRRPSEIKQGNTTTGVIGTEGGILTQMKNMWNEVSSTPPGTTSLPSQEVAGAKPGEHSDGVGALPGSIKEKGVAVLPDERNAAASSSGTSGIRENQGMLPGEVSSSGGALPGSSEAAVAPDAKKEEGAGGLLAAGAVGGAAAGALASSNNSYSGLAPALPQTTIGHGAAQGATDLANTTGGTTTPSNGHSLAPGTLHADDRTTSMASITAIHQGKEGQRSSEETKSSPLAAAPVTASDVSPAVAPAHTPSAAPTSEETRSATPTAVASHEDTIHNPTATPTSAETHSTAVAAATGAAAGAATGGVALASHEDGTRAPATAPIDEHNHINKKTPIIGDNATSSTGTPSSTLTESKTPGEIHHSVGHPATRDQEGTSREPGSYPKPDYNSKPMSAKEAAKSHDTGANGRASMDTAVSDNGARKSTEEKGRRKSSSASNGGKKVGFMKKLKGEMKVLGGKLTKDEDKVQEGEKIKHGEL